VVGASRVALIFPLLALVTASLTAVAQSAAPAPRVSYGAFALPDRSGSRLLLVSEVDEPERLRTALCHGRALPVQFERHQDAQPSDSPRVTADQFDRLSGGLFTVTSGRASDASACFLATEPFLAGRKALPVQPPTGTGACAPRAKWAVLRKRAVVRCWPLARLGARAKRLALVEFEPLGRDALASLVFADGDRATFVDYPAEYDEPGASVWRVDDGGEVSPDAFEIVFVLQRGAWTALGVSWSGAEGAALAVSISERGEPFREVLSEYWYQAPL
jgi:hypothetical protein